MKKVSSGSVLSKEYFISYLQLVMKSRGLTLEKASDYTKDTFFNGDLCAYGQQTFDHYWSAVRELRGS